MPRVTAPASTPPHSLRTELLVTTAILAAAAVLVAAVGAVLMPPPEGVRGAIYLGALVAGDVGVFVAFGAYQLRRLVTRPLDAAVAATEAIAAGDLSRRLPEGATSEFASLSASVNRMTDNLLEEQGQRLRAEKLATVGRLAAGIAHEVGNPLGAIDGYAHILRARAGRHDAGATGADDRTVREALDGIERESARIDRIVRGLLDYARPRRRTPARIDVNDVLRASLTLLDDQGLLRRLAVDVDVEGDGAPLTLVGQRHELEQAFVNVLLNAVDAIDDGSAGGGGRLVVRTRRVSSRELLDPSARRAGDPDANDFAAMPAARRRSPRVQAWLERAGQLAADAGRGDLAQVVIADSGGGVAEEDAERIFDPFYTTKEPGRGTGLGLAIVARVVESLRGAVWVQPSREGGAAFVLVFPLADAGASAAPVPASVVPPLARPRAPRHSPRQTSLAPSP